MGEEKKMGKKEAEYKAGYEDVRGEIRDGDILLYKGQTVVSRLIEFFTRSEYSHAGIAAWWNERLMVVEATHKGVFVDTLRRSIGRYNGDVEWWSCKKEIKIDQPARNQMVKYAQKLLGSEFAFGGLLLFPCKQIICFVIDLFKRGPLRKVKRFFCSSLVSAIYNHINLDLRKDKNDLFTSPADISNSPLLCYRATLNKKRLQPYLNRTQFDELLLTTRGTVSIPAS